MNISKKTLTAFGIACALGVHQAGAASIMPSGTAITGTTTPITLTAGSIITNPNGNTALSNSSGNLVIDFIDPNPGSVVAADNDFFLKWDGAGDGLNFSTATYTYVQVDVLSTSPSLVTSTWQLFFADTDSSVGGANNSGQNISGTPTLAGGGAFSFVIDLTDGNGTTGAMGWGPGNLTSFRLDPFQSNNTFDKSMTISAITFGSAVIPEPSSSLLALLGMAGAALRRKR